MFATLKPASWAFRISILLNPPSGPTKIKNLFAFGFRSKTSFKAAAPSSSHRISLRVSFKSLVRISEKSTGEAM